MSPKINVAIDRATRYRRRKLRSCSRIFRSTGKARPCNAPVLSYRQFFLPCSFLPCNACNAVLHRVRSAPVSPFCRFLRRSRSAVLPCPFYAGRRRGRATHLFFLPFCHVLSAYSRISCQPILLVLVLVLIHPSLMCDCRPIIDHSIGNCQAKGNGKKSILPVLSVVSVVSVVQFFLIDPFCGPSQ